MEIGVVDRPWDLSTSERLDANVGVMKCGGDARDLFVLVMSAGVPILELEIFKGFLLVSLI